MRVGEIGDPVQEWVDVQSPLQAGLWTLPSSGGFIVGSMLAPVLVRRVHPAFLIAAGLALAAVGLGALTQVDRASGLAVIVIGSVVLALGVAPAVTLGTDLIVGTAPPERAGAASAISETGTELGGALGIAILGSIGAAIYRTQVAHAVPAGVSPHAAQAARDTLGGAVAAAHQLPGPGGAELLDRAREAFTQGLQLSAGISAASAGYREARDRLLKQEIELRRATEAVAAARRMLPPGGVVPEDYVFPGMGAHGTPTEVRLSELFAPGKDSLVIYSLMFPRGYGGERPGPASGQTARLPLEEGPCPSCVALLDQLDGAAEHASQKINFAVVAKAPLPRLLTFAEERGWRRRRLLSSAGNTYNRDYLGETAEGSQMPMLNVFHRDGETIRHFWGAE